MKRPDKRHDPQDAVGDAARFSPPSWDFLVAKGYGKPETHRLPYGWRHVHVLRLGEGRVRDPEGVSRHRQQRFWSIPRGAVQTLDLSAIWAIQDRIALDADEEKAIELTRELFNER